MSDEQIVSGVGPILADLKAMGQLTDAPSWESLGLEKREDITIEGRWGTGVDMAAGQDFTVTCVFDPSGLRSYPRKMKKAAQKWMLGSPMGRRERQRIRIPIRVVNP